MINTIDKEIRKKSQIPAALRSEKVVAAQPMGIRRLRPGSQSIFTPEEMDGFLEKTRPTETVTSRYKNPERSCNYYSN